MILVLLPKEIEKESFVALGLIFSVSLVFVKKRTNSGFEQNHISRYSLVGFLNILDVPGLVNAAAERGFWQPHLDVPTPHQRGLLHRFPLDDCRESQTRNLVRGVTILGESPTSLAKLSWVAIISSLVGHIRTLVK